MVYYSKRFQKGFYMDRDELSQKTSEVKVIHCGRVLYFTLFATAIYLLSKNWIYAICFAVLLTGVLGQLCENNLRKCLGYVITIPFALFWISFNQLFCSKIIKTIQTDTSAMQLKDLNVFLTYGIADSMSVLSAIIFCIVLVIAAVTIQQLTSQLPEKWKLPVRYQTWIVFCVNFLRLLLLSVICSIIVSFVFEKIQFSASWIVWTILLFPWLFCYKIWQNTVKNIKEYNSGSDCSDKENKKISAIQIPDITLSDVAGMKNVKDEIYQRMILPLKNPAGAKKYGVNMGGGVLLYGPPGTGKTFFAKAVAGELKIPFYAITAADIFSKYVGESEKNIRDIFQELRKNKLSVLFIDELEAIFRSRSADIHETTRKIISILLQELDGIASNNSGMLLIGATNAPHLIDEAFLRTGRFDAKIFVGLPDVAARKQIIESNFADLRLPFEDGLIDALAECTENFSGADLKGFTQKVKLKAFSSNAKICDYALFQECLSGIYPASNTDLMSNIRQWETKFNNK